jgi:hypothetical protein
MDKQELDQCAVVVANQPGNLSKVTQLISDEGVNIEFAMTQSLGDIASLRFIFDKNDRLRKKLRCAGYQVLESQVFSIELPNRPGELNRLAQRLAKEEIDIRYLYAMPQGANSRVVFAVDDAEEAARIVEECSAALAGPDS